MRSIRKLLRLSWSDRCLVLEATLLLVVVRLGLWGLPFQTLQQWLNWSVDRLALRGAVDSTHPQGTSQRIVWAIEVVTWRMPGGAKCLARALAAQAMLRRRGQPARLCVGVAKTHHGCLEAHAWVEQEGHLVIGGMPDFTRFTPLLTMERSP